MAAPSAKPINFSGVYGAVQRGANGKPGIGDIQFTAEQATNLLSTLIVLKANILANEIGLYNISDNVKNGTAYWHTIDPLKWLTKAGPSDCSRTATTDMTINALSKTMAKAHVYHKYCNRAQIAQMDAMWGSIWGAGNDLNDALANTESAKVFDKFMEVSKDAIGGDFATIVEFGNLTAAITALTANPLSIATAEKNKGLATLAVADGRLKQVDALKTGSYPHINNDFVAGDLGTNNHVFTGDALGYAEELATLAHSEFGSAMDALRSNWQYPICECSGSFFNRLKKQITDAYPHSASMLNYRMNGMLAKELGMDLQGVVRPDAIVWDGVLFIARYDWDAVSKSIGLVHHRILLSIPQNWGVAIDVPNDALEGSQYEGMGLYITKSGNPDHGGAYFLETNYQVATKLLRSNYIVNRSYTATQS